MGWAADEFKEINWGDKRLNERMFSLCDSLSESTESPINQACTDWAETKAAYRFFRNDNISTEQIMSTHREKTAERASKQYTVLVIQDTSYFIYTGHPKTKGLGEIGHKEVGNGEKIYSQICPTVKSQKNISSEVPTIEEAVRLIAKRGGYLGRKNDGPPGTLVLWREWKRLVDLAEGWELAR